MADLEVVTIDVQGFFSFWLCWVFIATPGLSLVIAPRLSGSTECGILVPWPGIEPMSPALEGRVWTTGAPGKSTDIQFQSSTFSVLTFTYVKNFQ